jgi:hypothetical protein
MSYTMDFDTRCHLFEEPGEGWEEIPRQLHLNSRGLLPVLWTLG